MLVSSSKASRVLGLVLVLLGWSRLPAQEEVFSTGFQLGTGTRAVAMGGAFSALGGDYSASYWNPATLADIRRNEIFGTFTHLIRQNTAGPDGSQDFDPMDHRVSFTRLNNFGMAYAVPTIRGSLVFSFGFNRIKNYDANFALEWFNPTEDDRVNQAWRENRQGSLNAWILAGAVDVSPNMSLGVGLNFWTGGSEFARAFREVDIEDIYTFQESTLEQSVNNNINGFNVKFGSIVKFGRALRLALAVSTPVKYKVEEKWSEFQEIGFDDQALATDDTSGFFDYEIQSPWSFTAGASLKLLGLVVSGDVEYNDWTQVQFKSDPPIRKVSKTEANRIILDTYRPTTRLRLGAEFTLPMTALSFRAGYFRDPSVFRDRPPEEDKQFVSAGIGFLLDKDVKLDLALVHGFWKRFQTDLPGTDDIQSYVEDIRTYEGFVTLTYRF